MSVLRYRITLLFLLFFSISGVSSPDVASNGKALIISSYGSDYRWSNIIIDQIGFRIRKTNPGVDINVEYLSSELFAKTEVWVERINLILQNYTQEKPKVIVLVSDEAWMAFRQADTESFKDVPLVLCAVKPHSIDLDQYEQKHNTLTLGDFSSTAKVMKKYNSTGVFRAMNVEAYISLIDNTIPDVDNYAIVTDARFYGVYTHLVMENYLREKDSKKDVKFLDARFVPTDSLFTELHKVGPRTGVLMTSWLTGKVSFDYSREFVYKEMASGLKAPIFITNDIGLSSGNFIGGFFSSSDFWGSKTADMVVDILGGKPARDIAPEVFVDEQCWANWTVLKKFKLSENSFPNHTKYINRPVSVIDQYKDEFVILAVFFGLIFFGFIFVVRSNIKLKHAKEVAHTALIDYYRANKDLVHTQIDLKGALEKAETADKLKSSFISNMDNEIRTPLNNIVGFANQLSEMEEKEDIDQAITQIVDNSEQLLTLIMNILDFSQIEAGAAYFTSEDVDPDAVCRDVVNVFAIKKIPSVELVLAESDQNFHISGDPRRIVQVLSSFVDNAVKFTREGRIEVGYFLTEDGRQVEFYVQDTGIGVKEEHLADLFERFYKVDQYSSGSGLGLSISRKIVEILAGEIGVSSELGVGSRFWFRLKKQ